MPDRDKVISHFQDAIDASGKGNRWRFVRVDIIEDAIELLKEQEPRVLTWDEVEQAEVCWMEQRGYEPYVELDAADWNPKCYGKEIRCWSAKPTKKQQEAVKWDD